MLNPSTSARTMAAIASTSCAGIMRCGVATIRGIIGEGAKRRSQRGDISHALREPDLASTLYEAATTFWRSSSPSFRSPILTPRPSPGPMPAFVRSLFLRIDLRGGRKERHQACPKPRCPMAWDFATNLVNPKTPFYPRIDLLVLVLPNRVNSAISSGLEAKAARLRAAHPEQVSNLANGVAVSEQLGSPDAGRAVSGPAPPTGFLLSQIRSRRAVPCAHARSFGTVSRVLFLRRVLRLRCIFGSSR
jgi:hypothetical protein